MRTLLASLLTVLLAFNSAWASPKGVSTGAAAPDFTVNDSKGSPVSLKDFKGKVVVLEWFNHECPFVKKHYNSGNMQRLQKEMTDKGIVWLSINSSAEGKQGHLSADEAISISKEKGTASSSVLLDMDGNVGKLYGARTTPHMYVIDKDGKVAYQGAIDDNDSPDPAAIPQSKNYVREVVGELMNGKAVTIASTEPYGCSVKYKS